MQSVTSVGIRELYNIRKAQVLYDQQYDLTINTWIRDSLNPGKKVTKKPNQNKKPAKNRAAVLHTYETQLDLSQDTRGRWHQKHVKT